MLATAVKQSVIIVFGVYSLEVRQALFPCILVLNLVLCLCWAFHPGLIGVEMLERVGVAL